MSLLGTGLILGGNLLGSIYASSQSAKANQSIQDDMNRRMSKTEGLLKQERHSDPFSRPEVQTMLSKIREDLRGSMKSSNDMGIRSGATTQAKVADRGRVGKGYMDSMRGILSADGSRRDMVKNRYMQMLAGQQGQQTQLDLQQAQRWPQLMENLGNLSGTAVEAFS